MAVPRLPTLWMCQKLAGLQHCWIPAAGTSEPHQSFPVCPHSQEGSGEAPHAEQDGRAVLAHGGWLVPSRNKG